MKKLPIGLQTFEDLIKEDFSYIDKTGMMVLSPKFYFADGHSTHIPSDFHEGLALVATRDKNDLIRFGYIDKIGNMVISPQFDSADNFSGGLARVFYGNPFRNDEVAGYINKTGIMIWMPTR